MHRLPLTLNPKYMQSHIPSSPKHRVHLCPLRLHPTPPTCECSERQVRQIFHRVEVGICHQVAPLPQPPGSPPSSPGRHGGALEGGLQPGHPFSEALNPAQHGYPGVQIRVHRAHTKQGLRGENPKIGKLRVQSGAEHVV